MFSDWHERDSLVRGALDQDDQDNQDNQDNQDLETSNMQTLCIPTFQSSCQAPVLAMQRCIIAARFFYQFLRDYVAVSLAQPGSAVVGAASRSPLLSPLAEFCSMINSIHHFAPFPLNSTLLLSNLIPLALISRVQSFLPPQRKSSQFPLKRPSPQQIRAETNCCGTEPPPMPA